MSTLNTYNLKSPDSANTNIELDASGNIAVRAGSAASPSIYVTGDSNTGIYSPGADQVAISTNGTGRLFVDASGNIECRSYASIGTLAFANANGTEASPTALSTPQLIMNLVARGYDGSAYRQIAAVRAYNDGAVSSTSSPGFLALSTTPSGSTTAQERLRITSAGLVGVGTSSPGSRLTVNRVNFADASATGATTLSNAGITVEAATDTNNRLMFGIGSTGGAPWIQAQNTSSNATQSLILNPVGGLVGIGTSSPQALLDLAATAPTIQFTDTTSVGERNWRIGISDIAEGDFNITQETGDDTNTYASRLYISAAGNVGIGTTSPGAPLEVNGTVICGRTDGSAYIINRGGYSSSTVYAFWGNDTTGISNPAAGQLGFLASGSERARIDAGGRLLVGTSSTSTDTRAIFQGSSTNNWAVVRLCANTTTPADLGYLVFGDSSHNNAAWINAARDGGTWTSGSSHPTRLVFSVTRDGQASPTERLRIGNAGVVQVYDSSSNGLNVRTESPSGTGANLLAGYYSATSTTTGTNCFVVFANGNVQNTNNSYGALSDIKLKENIVDAGSQWSDIKALQVRKYNFKEGQTHTQIGLVAQEVELVSPGLVSESPDRDAEGNDLGTVTKSVNYSVLYMKAVKALQEAMERIETLEAKVAALESA